MRRRASITVQADACFTSWKVRWDQALLLRTSVHTPAGQQYMQTQALLSCGSDLELCNLRSLILHENFDTHEEDVVCAGLTG